MEIAVRQINRAAVSCDKGLAVAVFPAGIVELETGAASKPDGGNGFVLESRSEFIQATEAVSAKGNQHIDSDVKHIGCLAQAWLRTSGVHSSGICKGAGLRKIKKAGRLLCPPDGVVRRLTPGFCLANLAARLCGRRSRLRIRLRDAEVAADRVLANLVDDDFLGDVRAREVEEDWLVHGAILLFKSLVFDGHGGAELVALFVHATQFHSDIPNLLRLAPAGDGEFNVVPFAEAAELVDFVMVAGDERTHLAARHLQFFAGRILVRLYANNLAVHGFHVIAGGLGSEFGVN